MAKLQNDFTTPEQSKRLLELGLPKDSANLYINDLCNNRAFELPNIYSKCEWGDKKRQPLPSWSSGRLIEILCICAGIERIDFETLAMADIIWSEKLIRLIEVLVMYEKIDFSKLELK